MKPWFWYDLFLNYIIGMHVIYNMQVHGEGIVGVCVFFFHLVE